MKNVTLKKLKSTSVLLFFLKNKYIQHTSQYAISMCMRWMLEVEEIESLAPSLFTK